MAKGNLRNFLRCHRPDAEENADNNLNYALPTPKQYITWAAQIADGMAYLESMKFCHRDLAARNCMVDEAETVKIGDFGMARDVYYHEYYAITSGKRLMPIRWMSPEALKDGRFTTKSDVWSYGIVCYEMLTLGQQPYAGLGNDQVFNFVSVKRKVMAPPLDCPDFWYSLMYCCWRYDPRERPTFAQIVDHLTPLAADSFAKLSFVVNAENLNRQVYDFERKWSHEPYPSSDNEQLAFTDDEQALSHTSLVSRSSISLSDSCSCASTAHQDGATTPRSPAQKLEMLRYLEGLASAQNPYEDHDDDQPAHDRDYLLSYDGNQQDEYVMENRGVEALRRCDDGNTRTTRPTMSSQGSSRHSEDDYLLHEPARDRLSVSSSTAALQAATRSYENESTSECDYVTTNRRPTQP